MSVIAVIFGGISSENEISVITGTMAVNVLEKGGDRAVPVYISQKGDTYSGEILKDINVFKDGSYSAARRAVLANGGVYLFNARGRLKDFVRVDAAVNCCHGGFGEGGGVCGMCAMAGIPLASAGIFESAAFIDKYYTKLVLKSLGVAVAPYRYIREGEDVLGAEALGYPMIIKPAKLGSSIGVERADGREQLERAARSAFCYDDAFIAERYFADRREINCAVMRREGRTAVSECEEVFTKGDILSYDDKYAGGGSRKVPADLPENISRRIRAVCARVYNRLNMGGIVRFDFILSGDRIYLSEVNTVPGSLSYYLLSDGLKDFYPVLRAAVEQALVDWEKVQSKCVLSTGILKNMPSNACKRGTK